LWQKAFAVCLSWLAVYVAKTQDYNHLVLSGYHFIGMEKTRAWYVERELRYAPGDTLMLDGLKEAVINLETDLRRTHLFTRFEVKPLIDYDSVATVRFFIDVDENWYFYPSLIAELADRNFNVWWKEHRRSLERINLGFSLNHINLTGIQDDLRLNYHFGYTNRFALRYQRPAVSRNTAFGIGGAYYYTEYKETAVTTSGNKLVFVKDQSNILYIKREVSAMAFYKFDKFWNFKLSLHHFNNTFSSEMAAAYPDFFLRGDSRQKYVQGLLTANYASIDHSIRPSRGWIFTTQLRQTGIPGSDKFCDFSILQTAKTAFMLTSQLRMEMAAAVRKSLTQEKVPYNLYKGIGYTDTNISGYEYYVIDGLDYGYLNNQLRIQIGSGRWTLFRIIKGEPVLRIKLDIDLSLQFNVAYVNDPFYKENNPLVNTFLYSTGFGINFTVNDLVEFNALYSINHLAEKGIYFHTRRAF
jgi:outer membrane protein assembly factor BamA